jgi:hypothetical protein
VTNATILGRVWKYLSVPQWTGDEFPPCSFPCLSPVAITTPPNGVTAEAHEQL